MWYLSKHLESSQCADMTCHTSNVRVLLRPGRQGREAFSGCITSLRKNKYKILYIFGCRISRRTTYPKENAKIMQNLDHFRGQTILSGRSGDIIPISQLNRCKKRFSSLTSLVRIIVRYSPSFLSILSLSIYLCLSIHLSCKYVDLTAKWRAMKWSAVQRSGAWKTAWKRREDCNPCKAVPQLINCQRLRIKIRVDR